MCTKFTASQTEVADLFQVERKKFSTSITGRKYDPVCIFSATPPPYQSQYSPTVNIINYSDLGTMPQQNSTIIISTAVLETVSSSQLINHPFIPG